MAILETMLENVSTVAILGHIHPDGDCIGSCLGMYNYLKEQYPHIDTVVYLEKLPEKFDYLSGYNAVCSDYSEDKQYDLCICLDSADAGRLGEYVKYLKTAAKSFCIDHHITNSGYADENVIKPDASSACEVLYEQLDSSKISKAVAECIYTGIIHDTGVFKYSSTSAKTMRIAGEMMEKGIDFGAIIDGSFYRKNYIQNQILGRALLESITFLDGKGIFSVIKAQDMKFYGVTSADLDGIIDQLRITDGVECAIFIYEQGNHEYKVSMRSNKIVDVSRVAAYFGGGGHVRAAGCTISGSLHDVVNNLALHIEKQLDAGE